jgi:hypothetical protein
VLDNVTHARPAPSKALDLRRYGSMQREFPHAKNHSNYLRSLNLAGAVLRGLREVASRVLAMSLCK